MRTRFQRLNAARLSVLVVFQFLLIVAASARPASAADLNGTIVDQSGAPIPRAFVRAVDPPGGGYTFLASEIVESTSSFSPVLALGQSLLRRPRHCDFVGV
ncbi:MAG TPA: hypothetical protein VGY57_13900, partial [Vicinamibacterales bacterium]|nr:hypothetical protein [Vicinamibacterales bacterium]